MEEDSVVDIYDMTYATPLQRNDTAFKDTPSASAGGPTEKVPVTLYNSIQLVLVAKKAWELKRTEKSMADFNFAVDLLDSIAAAYKSKKLLPFDWEYNPDTAGTLEPKVDTMLPWLDGKKTYPSTELFKVNDVPLSPNEIESWLQFKCLDESTPKPSCLYGYYTEYPLSSELPFVTSLGSFVVDGYNEAFELFVEQGNYNRLCRPRVTACTYYVMDGSYNFNMTIAADEDGFTGIFEALVYCCCVDGKKTLMQILLRDVQQGNQRRKSKLKSPEGVCLPVINKYGTGMCKRGTINGISYGLYNYVDPDELIG